MFTIGMPARMKWFNPVTKNKFIKVKIMKKLFVIIFMLILVFAFASCDTPTDTGESGNVSENSLDDSSNYVFIVESANDFALSIDLDMKEVLDALGEPLSYFEAASCAFEGLDKTYTYAGFTVTTRPDGDKDYVNCVYLTDDSLTTPEGIYIGASSEEVLNRCGTPNQQTDTLISYVSGNTMLNFIIKDGAVISIEYLPA